MRCGNYSSLFNFIMCFLKKNILKPLKNI